MAFGSNMSGSFIRSTEVGTTVSGGGSVRLDAGRDVNARAAGVAAEGDLNVDAGRDIRIEAGRERTDFSYSAHWSSSNALRRKDTTVDAQAHSDNAIGSSFTGKNVTLDADRDIGISGSYVSAQDKLGLDAGRDVNIGVATNSSSTSTSTATQRTPTGLARAMSVPGVMVTIETSIPEPVAGTLLTNKGVRDNAMTQDVTVTGSLLTGASVDIKSGRDTTITGSQIIADHDVSVAAGNNLTVQSAQEAHVQGQGSVVHASGKTNSAGMPAFGVASGMSQTASSSVHQVGSQIVSLDGNVALSSGATYTQTASDVLALGIGADGKAGNIDIRAKNVVIQSADDTQLTVNLSRESHATFGGTANLGIVNTVKSVQALADASQRTNDSRAQALAAASTAVTIGQAISSGGFGSASIGVTQSKGHSHSQSAQVQSVPVGSTISAAGNVSITATGAGAGSNILVVGSAIEGENVSLAADNDVTLASAVGSSNSVSSSQSSQMSAGAALSVGSQTGLVFQGGAGKSSGGGTGLAVAHYNTTVTGAQSVSITSGGDTTMHGAVVTGEKVTASVGGDLSITSPQDVSISTAHDSTAGANVSLCVWWCVGNTVEFSGTVGQGGANSNYVSVGSQQSGIQAGDGGFDVDVAGDTRLVGGVIASTQAAVDAGANNFHTGGSLTMTDVVNQASHDGSGFSVTAGYNTTPSAGYGSVSGGQTGVSAAGISGIAGNTAVRTGGSSGGVQPGPSAANILGDVNAQIHITAAFSAQATTYLGSFASQRERELRRQAQSTADPDEMAQLQREADRWAEGGIYRTALHAVIGGLTGSAGGATGAGLAAAVAPTLNNIQTDIAASLISAGLDVSSASALGNIFTTGLAATLGTAGGIGGSVAAINADGNNRALHPEEINLANLLSGIPNGQGGYYSTAQILEQMRLMGNAAYGESPNTAWAVMATNTDQGSSSLISSYQNDPGMPRTSYGSTGVVEVMGAANPSIQQFIIENTRNIPGWIPGGSPYMASTLNSSATAGVNELMPSRCANGDYWCAAGVSAGRPNLNSSTLYFGLQGNTISGYGSSNQVGFYINPGLGQSNFDAGLLVSQGAGWGYDFGSSVFGGYITGGSGNLAGASNNINFANNVSSISYTVVNGQVVGGGLGIGLRPSAPGFTGSITNMQTCVYSIRSGYRC